MRRSGSSLLVLLGVLGVAVVGSAAEPPRTPVIVSPGSAAGVAVGGGCPTFSWGTVAGATSYELVIYRVGDAGAEAAPVLRQHLAGTANSWTPSLDRCLGRGGRYAWSLRATVDREVSEWSPASIFSVPGKPTLAEVDAALGVLRSYRESVASREPGTVVGSRVDAPVKAPIARRAEGKASGAVERKEAKRREGTRKDKGESRPRERRPREGRQP